MGRFEYGFWFGVAGFCRTATHLHSPLIIRTKVQLSSEKQQQCEEKPAKAVEQRCSKNIFSYFSIMCVFVHFPP